MLSPLNPISLSETTIHPASKINGEASLPARDDELRKSARDFEATFIAQMLTFSGLDKSLMSGGGEEVAAFTSFFIESLSEKIADNGGLGLADNFYERLVKLSQQVAEPIGDNNRDKFSKL